MNFCEQCKNNFEVTDADRKFYERIGPIIAGWAYPVSEPKICPICRQQRRLAFRNERMLYVRTSSLSGKRIISCHAPEMRFPVFSQDEWFSDAWDGRDYGVDFDFNKPFFEQFKALRDKVPHMNINIWQSNNCDYCNFTDFSQNCYLIFGASNCKDSYYSNLINSVVDCIDLTGCKKSERCYDCIDCVGCTNMIGSIRCENSHNIAFCFDCRNCEDSMLCFNLSRKKYCILNKQFSKEEFFEKKKQFNFGSSAAYAQLKEKLLELVGKNAIHRYVKTINCEACTGDNLTNSKNSLECFESDNLQDCKYVQFSMNSKDAYDVIGSSNTGCELTAEAISVEGHKIFSGYWIAGLNNVYYCNLVLACQDIFGCIGLKHKQYCILNKQYSKQEYEELLLKIIQHMQKTGEWGEFFPISVSPFAYNETIAQEYFPVSKEKALAAGWAWRNIGEKSKPMQTHFPPDNIADADEKIIGEVFDCGLCFKQFRLIAQEYKFYREMNIPIPQMCPDCRHKKRMQLRNPRQLWIRACEKCHKQISSTFAPDRPEIVYCQKCYLEAVI